VNETRVDLLDKTNLDEKAEFYVDRASDKIEDASEAVREKI